MHAMNHPRLCNRRRHVSRDNQHIEQFCTWLEKSRVRSLPQIWAARCYRESIGDFLMMYPDYSPLQDRQKYRKIVPDYLPQQPSIRMYRIDCKLIISSIDWSRGRCTVSVRDCQLRAAGRCFDTWSRETILMRPGAGSLVWRAAAEASVGAQMAEEEEHMRFNPRWHVCSFL